MRRRWAGSIRGASVLEIALFVPILVTLLVGMIQIGKITYVYYTLRKTLYTMGRFVSVQQGVNFCDAGDLTVLAAKNFALNGLSSDDGTDPLHRGACDGRCAGMFDFIDLQTSPKDGTVWASFTDTCTAGNGCTTQRKDNLATDAQGIAVRTTGYSLIANAPTPAPATSVTGPTAPSAPSPVDSVAPKVEALRVDGRRVSWRLSEAGSVSVQVVRDGAILGSLTTGRPSTSGSTRLPGARAGDTVVVRATDAAGNQGDAATTRIAV